MLEIIPIAMPATLVVVAAAYLVRRERTDDVVDLTAWDDVPVVSLGDQCPAPTERPPSTGGALIEPDGSSLGARLRETTPPNGERRRVRVRRRDHPLTAARPDR